MNVQNNLSGLGGLKSYHANVNNTAKGMAQISSGLRINSAADDAAGLAISEKLRSQVRGLDMVDKGARDGMNLLNTVGGAMGAVGDLLGRMRELSVQSSNGIYGDTERDALNSEFNSLKNEVARIASTTNFNGENLIDGSASAKNGGIDIQVGTASGNDQKVSVALNSLTPEALNIESLDLSSQEGASNALSAIDDAINAVSTARGDVGAAGNILEHTVQSIAINKENIVSADSRIRDMDMAKAAMNNTKNQILTAASVAMMAQSSNISQMAMQLLK